MEVTARSRTEGAQEGKVTASGNVLTWIAQGCPLLTAEQRASSMKLEDCHESGNRMHRDVTSCLGDK